MEKKNDNPINFELDGEIEASEYPARTQMNISHPYFRKEYLCFKEAIVLHDDEQPIPTLTKQDIYNLTCPDVNLGNVSIEEILKSK